MAGYGDYLVGASSYVGDESTRFPYTTWAPGPQNTSVVLSGDEMEQLVYRTRQLRIHGDYNGNPFDFTIDLYSSTTDTAIVSPGPNDESDIPRFLSDITLSSTFATRDLTAFSPDGGVTFSFLHGLHVWDATDKKIYPSNSFTVSTPTSEIASVASTVSPVYSGTFLGKIMTFQQSFGPAPTGSVTIEAPPTNGYWPFQLSAQPGPCYDADTGVLLIDPIPKGT